MNLNVIAILSSALVPLIVGFIWYNPKVMGTIWMRETGIKPESNQDIKMAPILIANLVAGVFLAAGLVAIVIHQQAIYSILANEASMKDPSSPLSQYVADFMSKYGSNFRTFKHGMLHGFLATVMLILPAVTVSSLWERRSWKYIGLTFGYWAITLMLMGGIICQFA
jgi:Protein of unknown function (DUF1761)